MSATVSDFISVLKEQGLLLAEALSELSYESQVEGISFDNRSVKKGELFVCKGAAFKVEYLLSAMESGALFYVSETEWSTEYPHLLVKDIRLAMAAIAKCFYGEDASSLVKIGVTGTKGKTTVVTCLNALLDNYRVSQGREKTALISSLKVYDGVNDVAARLSTPEAFDLWRALANAGKRDLGYAVCEVSSQALKYHRTKGVDFDVAVFLNIGEDHISDIEHKDFNDYFFSKLLIFENAKIACINSSSDKLEKVLETANKAGCEIVTFGFLEADNLFCRSYEIRSDGVSFDIVWNGGQEEHYEISLAGRYNLENALAALAVGHILEIPAANMMSALSSVSVDGRGVRLSSRDGKITVIVDYAHNKMSFEALFGYTREAFPGQKVVCLFGCPGGKAKNRRKDMGLCAGANADYVIVTEDDCGKESLASICHEIVGYVAMTKTPYEVIDNRGDAIRRAISLVREGGVVLLCGKGAENTQKRGNASVFYETDKYHAEQCIQEYDKEKALYIP